MVHQPRDDVSWHHNAGVGVIQSGIEGVGVTQSRIDDIDDIDLFLQIFYAMPYIGKVLEIGQYRQYRQCLTPHLAWPQSRQGCLNRNPATSSEAFSTGSLAPPPDLEYSLRSGPNALVIKGHSRRRKGVLKSFVEVTSSHPCSDPIPAPAIESPEHRLISPISRWSGRPGVKCLEPLPESPISQVCPPIDPLCGPTYHPMDGIGVRAGAQGDPETEPIEVPYA
jgi:hypothetical protein